MAVRFQLRRDTASNWTVANPTLALGEPGVETDTLKLKVGNGSSAWNSLAYSISQDFADLTNTPTTLAGYGISDAVSVNDTGTVTNDMLAGSIANNKLANSAITVNGVTVALGSSGTITATLPVATSALLGGVIIGSGIAVASDGTISVDTIDVATDTTTGVVIVGSGLQVQTDGTVSTTTTPAFHGFVVNTNGDLEYTRMTSGDFAVANGDNVEQYVMWEIGTSDYSWQITDDGVLQIQYTDSN